MLPSAPVNNTFKVSSSHRFRCGELLRAARKSSSMRGLRSARVGALAWLGGAEDAVEGIGGVEAPMERQRQATPSVRSSSRALWASASA